MFFLKRFSVLLAFLMLYTLKIKSQNAEEITKKMISTVKSIKSLSYTSDLKERVNGILKTEKASFKLNVEPFKVYMYMYFPKLGRECLYATGTNNGKAWINCNSFPWVTLSLSPESKIMLEERHHSIFDAGFLYTALTLEYLMNKYPTEKMITLNGIVSMQGEKCYYITLANPKYKMISYTTQQNETPQSIAEKLKLNFYSILENNPSLDLVDVIKPGTKLIVPSDYASKMELYVHTDKFYPVYLRVYDNKGLYEEYSFFGVTINAKFTDTDFAKDNPDYGF
jgi:outer membrane lipoprotein-sorting protein